MAEGLALMFAKTMIEENMIIVVYITIWLCVDMRIIWIWYMHDMCTHFLPGNHCLYWHDVMLKEIICISKSDRSQFTLAFINPVKFIQIIRQYVT